MKKILFISYIFLPDSRVGSFRVSYWAKNISKYGYEVDAISTTAQQNTPKGVSKYTHIDVPSNSSLRYVSSDQGISWGLAIRQYLKSNSLEYYQYVLISGGPFGQFLQIPFLKRQFPSAKIVLDYRDPFSNNPRGKSSAFSSIEMIRSLLNRCFLKWADAVITTNKQFVALIDEHSKYREKITVIDNGFDETVVADVVTNLRENKIVNGQSVSFVYTGSFLFDRNPDNFLVTLNKYFPNYSLRHLGKESFEYEKYEQYKALGQQRYERTMELACGCDVGVVIVGDGNHESTTKVFDYMALSLPVLIITNGELNRGGIHEATENYGPVVWCYNDVSSIRDGVTEIYEKYVLGNQAVNCNFDVDQYSRGAGLRVLVSTLDSLMG